MAKFAEACYCDFEFNLCLTLWSVVFARVVVVVVVVASADLLSVLRHLVALPVCVKLRQDQRRLTASKAAYEISSRKCAYNATGSHENNNSNNNNNKKTASNCQASRV